MDRFPIDLLLTSLRKLALESPRCWRTEVLLISYDSYLLEFAEIHWTPLKCACACACACVWVCVCVCICVWVRAQVRVHVRVCVWGGGVWVFRTQRFFFHGMVCALMRGSRCLASQCYCLSKISLREPITFFTKFLMLVPWRQNCDLDGRQDGQPAQRTTPLVGRPEGPAFKIWRLLEPHRCRGVGERRTVWVATGSVKKQKQKTKKKYW